MKYSDEYTTNYSKNKESVDSIIDDWESRKRKIKNKKR